MAAAVPIVDYLVLGDAPHLVAKECTSCGARFFDRRNACASCYATEFKDAAIANEGEALADRLVHQPAVGQPRLGEDRADGRRRIEAAARAKLRLREVVQRVIPTPCQNKSPALAGLFL